ncbi:UNVERIFIED_ORG: hypothetical protein ABIC54_004478 [Burkholderia sp. 1263]
MDKFVDVTVRIPVPPNAPNAQDIGLAVYVAFQLFNGVVPKPFGKKVYFFLDKAEVINISESAED